MLRKYLTCLSLCVFAFSANAARYEVLKNGNDLLIKEKDEFVLVGSDVLAPVKLPYKEDFYLLDDNGSGYNVSNLSNSMDLSNWTRLKALVYKGNFLDTHSGDEWFVQGKDITFSDGAKNAYITSAKKYIPDHNQVSAQIAAASAAQLKVLIKDGRAYLELDTHNRPTFHYHFEQGVKLISEDIGSLAFASDETLVVEPVSTITKNGTFSSSYPIDLPVSAGGVKPRLSIAYNSNGPNNGLLGYGFGLGGIETISHCKHNSDAINSGYKKTNLTSDESLTQYCYNGTPLVGVDPSSGTAYSAISNSAQYFYVKNDPKQRVSKSGTRFIIKLPSGKTKIFEKVNDLTWALKQVDTLFRDAAITYTYVNTGSQVDSVQLSSISWGEYSASLEYSSKRNDYNLKIKNDARGFFATTKLLTDITIKHATRTISSNHLSYKLLGFNKRYAVEAIQTCGYVPMKDCAQPVQYKWQIPDSLVGKHLMASSLLTETQADRIFSAKVARNSGEELFTYDDNKVYKVTSSGKSTEYTHAVGEEKIAGVYPVRRNGLDSLFILTSKSNVVEKPWQSGDPWPTSTWRGGQSCTNSSFVGYPSQNPSLGNHDYKCRDNAYESPRGQCGKYTTASGQTVWNHTGSSHVTYFCNIPYTRKTSAHLSWYRVDRHSSGNSWLTKRKVTDAGCYADSESLPSNFLDSSPLLIGDRSATGQNDVYLKTLTKNNAVSDQCLTEHNKDEYKVQYKTYRTSDMRFTSYWDIGSSIISGLKVDTSKTYAKSIKIMNKFGSTPVFGDFDGNGVQDEYYYFTQPDGRRSSGIRFLAPSVYSFSPMVGEYSYNPNKGINAPWMDKPVAFDLDQDGAQELLYTTGNRVNYMKFVFNSFTGRIEQQGGTLFSTDDTIAKVGLADFDNDGTSDIYYTTSQGKVAVRSMPHRTKIHAITYGNYHESISYEKDAITLGNSVVASATNQRPPYEVVGRFEKQFVDATGVTKPIVDMAYDYENPLRHNRYSYNLGFEKITRIDNLARNKIITEYYQDVQRRGLKRSVTQKSYLAAEYRVMNKKEFTYSRNGQNNYGFGLNSLTKNNFIRGELATTSVSTYSYDDYGREKAVLTELLDADGSLQKSEFIETTYKRNAFDHVEPIDMVLSYKDSTLTIPNGSYLVTQRRQLGSKTMRTVYTENSEVEGAIQKEESGYLDANGNLQPLRFKDNYASRNSGGNTIESSSGGYEVNPVFIEYEDYQGANPQTIKRRNGSSYDITQRTYDALGRVTSETSSEGITNSVTYDAFGRIKSIDTSRDDATYRYLTCEQDALCASLPFAEEVAYVDTVSWMSGKSESVYTDAFGRAIGRSWNNALDETMLEWKAFDSKGRVVKEYLPCKLSHCTTSSPAITYEYEFSNDAWATQKTLADGTTKILTRIRTGDCSQVLATSSVCRTPNDSAVTPLFIKETQITGKHPLLGDATDVLPTLSNGLVKRTFEIYDNVGDVFASVDSSGASSRAVLFSRNITGDKTEVHTRVGDRETLVRRYTYTDAGLLRSEINSATGVTQEYIFNIAGQVKKKFTFGSDEKLYAYEEYGYDFHNRVTNKVEAQSLEGVVAESMGMDYSFSNASFIGRNHIYSYGAYMGSSPEGYSCLNQELCSESVTDDVTNVQSLKHYDYTADGLAKGKTEITTDHNTGVEKSLSAVYTYTPYGELSTERLGNYVIEYDRNNGELTRISDNHNEVLWRLNKLTSNGMPEEAYTLGENELSFSVDASARITQSVLNDAMASTVSAWEQDYTHLGSTAYRRSATPSLNAENFVFDIYGQIDKTTLGGTAHYDYSIDDHGNLTQKRGVELDYGEFSDSCSSLMDGSELSLLPAEAKSNSWTLSATLGSSSEFYCFDKLGRQSVMGTTDTHIQYAANSQVTRMRNATADLIFAYDSNNTPVYEKQTSSIAEKNYTAWLFDAGRYEMRSDNGVMTTRIYPGNNIRVTFTQGDAVPRYDYIMRDTMGSVTGLARKAGDQLTVDRSKIRSYTPYGEHRTEHNWDTIQDVDIDDAYGFTGQRYLKEFGLYQFVGRIYDPKQGRFTSPDPLVPNPKDWKSYNPYSYVFNDPMGWTDPSGYYPVCTQSSIHLPNGGVTTTASCVEVDVPDMGSIEYWNQVIPDISNPVYIPPIDIPGPVVPIRIDIEPPSFTKELDVRPPVYGEQEEVASESSLSLYVDRAGEISSGVVIEAVENPVPGTIASVAGMTLATEKSILTASGKRAPQLPLYYGMDIESYNKAMKGAKYLNRAGNMMGGASYTYSFYNYIQEMRAREYKNARRTATVGFYGALMMAPPHLITIPVGLTGIYLNSSESK